MFILDHRRKSITNFSHVVRLAVDEELIVAEMANGKRSVIARYASAQRANEVFLVICTAVNNHGDEYSYGIALPEE